MKHHIAFMGGGNMASAIVGGLLRQGVAAQQLLVVDPLEAVRQRWTTLGVTAHASAGPALAQTQLVVWAVKPQVLALASTAAAPHVGAALHLSVAAGITSDSIAGWLRSQRVVRAMPNTPALVGLGQTGLYARASVSDHDRTLVEQVLSAIGQTVWVAEESLLDAVTALSGSGPAYVFYFIETMVRAGQAMGLSESQARQLAVGTVAGAAEMARISPESPAVLREQVTSKGGTTAAALAHLEANKVGIHFQESIEKARIRAHELGREFG